MAVAESAHNTSNLTITFQNEVASGKSVQETTITSTISERGCEWEVSARDYIHHNRHT
jgi:hypothetical protein